MNLGNRLAVGEAVDHGVVDCGDVDRGDVDRGDIDRRDVNCGEEVPASGLVPEVIRVRAESAAGPATVTAH
ncbi:MAG: hypothetical protein ACT4O0_17000 [Pseudonocardia sp.]